MMVQDISKSKTSNLIVLDKYPGKTFSAADKKRIATLISQQLNRTSAPCHRCIDQDASFTD